MFRLLVVLPLVVFCQSPCTRTPYEAKGDKRPGNNGYVVEIDAATAGGDTGAAGFVPGQKYKSIELSTRRQSNVQYP